MIELVDASVFSGEMCWKRAIEEHKREEK